MKYLYWVTLFPCFLSCKNKETTPEPRTTAVIVDTFNFDLDYENALYYRLDSLPEEDARNSQIELAYVKYRLYRNAIPIRSTGGQYPVTGAVINQDKLSFLLSSPAHQDSLLNQVPDTLEKLKVNLIVGLLARAQYMYDRSHYGQNDSLNGELMRSGIKYGWGSKHLEQKYNPFEETKKSDRPSPCNVSLIGLDCSGFIYQLFKQNGIKIKSGSADDQRQDTNMKKYLSAYFKNSSRFTPKNFPKLRVDSIVDGDIIYFFPTATSNVAGHIGIALNIDGKIKLFHSSGGRKSCDKNISEKGGIRCVNIRDYIGRDTTYGVTRLVINPR